VVFKNIALPPGRTLPKPFNELTQSVTHLLGQRKEIFCDSNVSTTLAAYLHALRDFTHLVI
jgi:hypothetical protein